MARNVEGLLVYQKAVAASAEVSAIIRRPVFWQDRRLRDQLGSASERVISTMAEGSEQSTGPVLCAVSVPIERLEP